MALNAVATLAVLAACVGDEGGRAEPVETEEERGQADLASTLLVLEDMPEGWVDLDLHYSAVEPCSGVLFEYGDELPKATASFATPERASRRIPDLFEVLRPVAGGAGAAMLEAVRSRLDMCGHGGEVDAHRYVGDEELPLRAFGDESLAWRVTIQEPSGQTLSVDMVYGRLGDLIVGVGVIEPPHDTRRLEEFATLAFERAAVHTPTSR